MLYNENDFDNNVEILKDILIRKGIILNNVVNDRIIYKIDSFSSSEKEDYYIDNIDKLKDFMKKSYNLKSSKRLEYFLLNKSIKTNKKTNETTNYLYSNNGIFKFYNNFQWVVNEEDITQSKVKFEETEEGNFLYNYDRLSSIKKLSKVNYLDYLNKDKLKMFITFTLPNKQFHKYNNKGKLTKTYESTEKLEENIIKGLKHLNHIHRYFYEILKKKITRYNKKNNIDKEVGRVDFIKMLEPHKSLDGHLHSLFYIDKIYQDILIDCYNLTIKKFGLLQTKLEKLREAKASSYLTKYLLKTTKSENLLYNHYKRYFSNIRFFSSSNFRYTNMEQIEIVYKYLSKNHKELIEDYKQQDIPLYYNLEQLIIKGIFKFEEVESIGYTVDYEKINQEFEELKNEIEKELGYWYEDINPEKNKWLFGRDKEDIEDKKKWLDNLKDTKIYEFQDKILRNIHNYLKVRKSKNITKVYYKDNLIIDRSLYTFEEVNYNYFRKLKLDPFLDKESEEKVFKNC